MSMSKCLAFRSDVSIAVLNIFRYSHAFIARYYLSIEQRYFPESMAYSSNVMQSTIYTLCSEKNSHLCFLA